ncbi:hypothetical protein BN946_scf184962.g86 [Trametes cinnabarina]|uniref:Uncharacterized protein n=1 Tax=Pycnoporus cinnabarinus TaxID=5643 RepID=A0A060SI80_PYCCI|nr:hypothetical protein BN946_scf184962.g86 [Trametes cinnabarina]
MSSSPSSTTMPTPTVSFTSNRGMLNIVADKLRPSPLWQPVHVALANVTPLLRGLVISGIVARNKGVNLCAQGASMFSIVVQTDTMIMADEHLLNISFLDTSGRQAWPEFSLRFNESGVYWNFVQALAEAKRNAQQHDADIADALSKIRDTFPQETDEGESDDDDDDLSIVGRSNLGFEHVQ